MNPVKFPESFDDIHKLILSVPGPDLVSAKKTREHELQLTKPTGAFGQLEKLSEWTASWQGKYPPAIDHAVVCVFAGSHGIAQKQVSAYPPSVNRQMLDNFINEGAGINALSHTVGCKVHVTEIDMDNPTHDFSIQPAMSEQECVAAFVLGMKAIPEQCDILAVGELGIGNTTTASAIYAALYGGTASDWVGRGSGVDDSGLKRKNDVVATALNQHKDFLKNPLEILARMGGREIAAIAGAVLMARLRRIPAVLDGFICCSGPAVLHAVNPSALDHCLAGHVSAEGAHGKVLDKLGKEPILSLGMRLGEGTGAVLAIGIVKAALDAHNRMATFAEASVDNKL